MKVFKFISAALILFTAVNFTACSGDVEPIDPSIVINPDGPDPEDGVFKVDFDGQTFTSTNTLMYMSGGSLIINAIRTPQGDSFGMVIDGNTVGTYPANGSLLAYSPAGSEYAYVGNHPTDPTANTGSFTITSINTTDQTISGTFNFTGYWSNMSESVPPKEFTNGSFTNIPYTTQNPTGDTFSAKVNGVDFNDTDIFTVVSGVGSTEYISVGATNAAGNELTISMRSDLPPGTYNLTGDLTVDVVQINYGTTTTNGEYALNGTVVITAKTPTQISGTFSGNVIIGAVTYQITEGSFSVQY